MAEIIIYRKSFSTDEKLTGIDLDKYVLNHWKPFSSGLIPPQKKRKYLFYTLFHLIHIFKNRDYSAFLAYDKDKMIASMLVVPAHFKWPFMGKDDLQFTYVMTNPSYRGKGIAEMMLRAAIQKYKKKNRNFWYVTDTDNPSSMRLCTKVEFEFWSYGKRNGILKILKKVTNS